MPPSVTVSELDIDHVTRLFVFVNSFSIYSNSNFHRPFLPLHFQVIKPAYILVII